MNPLRSRLRHVSLLWPGAAGLAIGVLVSTGLVLMHLREEQVAAQTRELGLLSMAQARELTRGIQGAEEGLQALGTELRDARLHPASPAIAPALKARADLMPMIRSLWLVDPHGRLLAASDPSATPALQSFANLPPPTDNPLADLSISRPVPNDQAPGELIVLAMHFVSPQDRLQGWMLAGIPSELLLGSFGSDSLLANARVVLFDRHGQRLAGGESNGDAALASVLRPASPPTTGVRVIDLNGKSSLVARRDLDTPPVTVLMVRNMDEVLASWRESARFAAAGALLLVSILFVAAALIERARVQQERAQQAFRSQLARGSKLEALGTLAGGVAHDFNNILAAILGYGEMAQDGVPAGSAPHRQLDKLIQAALRGKALVERILIFSRGGAHASQVFELEPVVEEVLSMLSASLRSGIVIERDFAAPDARIKGDPTQVFEAVMNLSTNAMQAMQLKGTLEVRLSLADVANEKILSHGRLQPGHYVALMVGDQGHGIDNQAMERLFEPFFTTRAAQSGTGLGLAVVHGVVTDLGGAIDVWSQPDIGSRFTVYLPLSGEAPDRPATAAPKAPTGDRQWILVVDDQPDLVHLTEHMLQTLGYRTTGLTDPASALDLLRAHPGRFAALITDEAMPGMTGTALIEALRPMAPNLPVLLITGYGGPLLAARAAAAGATVVLGKPLMSARLGNALAQALAQAPTSSAR